jgi:hypothetical protein
MIIEGAIMAKIRLRIPVKLFIAIAITLVLGLVAGPVIKAITTQEQQSKNVLLSAIPFILIFVSILLTFISLIYMSASLLNDNISSRLYKSVENVLISGIVLGIFGMFQPWIMLLYKVGFMVLLVSTLGFIWWSHVKPKVIRRQKGTNGNPVEESKTVAS